MFRTIWIVLFICFILYTIWVYAYCDTEIIHPSRIEKEGWAIWQNKNCQSCHQLYGLGGYMGPDLTNIIATRDTHYIKTFIKYGTGSMPDFHLSDSEVSEVLAFLAWVDKTGKSNVSSASLHWSGSYIINKK